MVSVLENWVAWLGVLAIATRQEAHRGNSVQAVIAVARGAMGYQLACASVVLAGI